MLSVPDGVWSPCFRTDHVSLAIQCVRRLAGPSAGHLQGSCSRQVSAFQSRPVLSRPRRCRQLPSSSGFRPITLFSSNLMTKPTTETVSIFSPTRRFPSTCGRMGAEGLGGIDREELASSIFKCYFHGDLINILEKSSL